MFEHSVKVPRNLKTAANILKKVSIEGGSVKTLLYENKLRHFNKNELYALITKTIQHAAELEKIFELCSLFQNEPRLDPWLAKVLATELLFGKKCLPGISKPEKTIISYKEQFEKHTFEQPDEKTQAPVRPPRYVRINTNLLTTSDAIRAFQDEGYKFIRCTSGSYDDYLKQVQELTEYDFTQDYHVKYMFVFAPGTKFHEHDLYLENKIILQDKATAMAVHLLAPPPGSVVLDMCAAPGMKTTQLAAFMRNQGKIYAVERDERRYHTLCDFVEKTGSKCVETLHKDALELKRGDYDDVEYIILDPSCSGSGMQLSVHNYVEDTRLAKLTSLQEKFLKHAMNAFPNAKRIVYSTCSLFPEENERVVTNVVKTSRAKWRVQDVKEILKGQWNNIGSGMYGSMGARCMYARPDSDYTIGFFLAVLDRDQKDLEKSHAVKDSEANENLKEDGDEPKSKKKKKKKDREIPDALEEHDNNNEDLEPSVSKKKKRKNKDVVNGESNDVENDTENSVTPKKKKKKNKDVDTNDESNHKENFTENTDNQEECTTIPNKESKKIGKGQSAEAINGDEDLTEVGEENLSKKSKKKKKRDLEDTEAQSVEEYQQIEKPLDSTKKKKKKHKDVDVKIPTENQNGEFDESNSSNKKKNKKRKKDVEVS